MTLKWDQKKKDNFSGSPQINSKKIMKANWNQMANPQDATCIYRILLNS